MTTFIRAVAQSALTGLGRRFLTMASDESRPIEASIRRKLSEAFKPAYLEIINESHMHNVPKGSESHFKVIVVSDQFENQPLIKRHRLVNAAVEEELQTAVHAFSIVAKTPKQWEESPVIGQSPPCRGGAGL